jgi:CelD/BcsL family acetyltransferase involved in cellulose biosynthesis
MEAYLRSLSTNKRQQMKAERKRFSVRRRVVVQRCERSAELPQFLDALLELHHKRWKTQGEEGSFRRKPELAEFYKQFAPVALTNGWLWLFALRDCGEYKAVQLGYVYNDVFHQLQEGFDPDYEPGAGNLLRTHVIEACIAAGIRTIDFLGGVTEHKRRWLAEKRIGCDIFIGKRTLKNHPLFALGVWPTGRYLRPTGL